LKNHIFAKFPAKEQKPLPELCLALWEEQKKNWPQFAQANSALFELHTRSISIGTDDVTLQFNPKRALSSGAAVDKESLKSRPCFLCVHNLPREQKGILYKNNYLILCNPAPVFDKHFTIAYKQHLPQAIASSMLCFLDLTHDLAPNYAIFYNGPACGASAPDHLHFQAIPADSLPLVNTLYKHFKIIKKISGVNFYAGEKINRAVIILEGENKNILQKQFGRLINILQKNTSSPDEPMINVIGSYTEHGWRLIIFPRRKHRSGTFYLEGKKRIFVSFGAIDMAGFIITPLRKDFVHLDAAQISSLYREVSLESKEINHLIEEL
jgi:hypothetical protein